MPAIGWYNGTLGALDEMTVPVNDRAVYFGDGCYEACLAVGSRPFALEAHLNRFYRSLLAFEEETRNLRVRTARSCTGRFRAGRLRARMRFRQTAQNRIF